MPTLEHWHSPTVLSEREVIRMQRDAQQRVRRMQQQADETVRRAAGNLPPALPPPFPKPPAGNPSAGLAGKNPPARGQEPHPAVPGPRGGAPAPSPLQALLQDQDLMLILALLILLRAEKADLPLLLAIGYLLL